MGPDTAQWKVRERESVLAVSWNGSHVPQEACNDTAMRLNRRGKCRAQLVHKQTCLIGAESRLPEVVVVVVMRRGYWAN